MPDDQDQRRQVSRHPRRPECPGHDVGHFIDCVAQREPVGSLAWCAFEAQARRRHGCCSVRNPVRETLRGARKQASPKEWDDRQESEQGRENPAPGHHLASESNRVGHLSSSATLLGEHRSFDLVESAFADVVAWENGDGAQRPRTNVLDALIRHGDTEEARVTEGLDVRPNLFEVPAKRLFTVVDTEHGLKAGLLCLNALNSTVTDDAVEHPDAMPSLVREVQEPAPFVRTEFADLFEPAVRRAPPAELRRPQSGKLSRDEAFVDELEIEVARSFGVDPKGQHLSERVRATSPSSNDEASRVQVQGELQREVVGESGAGGVDRRRVGTELQLPNHARPTWKRQQGLFDVRSPLLMRDVELFERPAHCLVCVPSLALLESKLLRKPFHPAIRRA